MSRKSDFRSTLTSLWFRLITLGIVGLVFAVTLWLAPGKAQGWSYYLTKPVVIFEVLVRMTFAALAGGVVGTLFTAALAPFLWYFKSSRERIADWATKLFVVLVVFIDGKFALQALIWWVYQQRIGYWIDHRAFVNASLPAAYVVAFVLALCIPRARKQVVTSLDGFLGEKMTRRTAIATVAGTAALVATEYALARSIPAAKAALVAQRPKSNMLLITFDALSAEDMSFYGYKLPTTPNLDAFARKATVFTNFYSASTFTTPCVATILTGIYPSESHVYQLQGHVRTQNAAKTLPYAMREAGYTTAAFLSNPWAYSGVAGLHNDYDSLPEPIFQEGGLQHLWEATTPLHQDSGLGCRMDEYLDLAYWFNFLGRLPSDLAGRFRAVASFEQARELLAKLPDGYFLWIHVMTPHSPYLPDAADRGRFLPDDQLHTDEEDAKKGWSLRYKPDEQSQIDQRRLAYDEFVATADRAFGAFMSELENGGKLRDTTVIVSADHGESFEGGVYQHRSPYQTRPVIHVPLMIRTPGQQDGRKVAFTADQTTLAPTILDLAGVPKPDWMLGQSLAGWLNRDGQGEGEGMAFCQYLEKNSVFKPIHHGTVGVIDGKSQYQYVWDIESEKGSLKPLNEAQIWNLDRSAESPALAEQLRAAIMARFPELVQKPS